MEKIEIPLSKTKLILALLGCTAFVAAGMWIWLSGKFDVITEIIGGAGALFFALGFMVIPKQLFSEKPGLIIDAAGITLNCTGFERTTVYWTDVKGFGLMTINSTKLMLIYVQNPEHYIPNSFWKAKAARMNIAMCGTPVSIASTNLAITFPKLQSLLEQAFDFYAPKNAAANKELQKTMQEVESNA